eukprot:Polyplicarium_translucidae@DN2830_c1_g1_i1.p1
MCVIACILMNLPRRREKLLFLLGQNKRFYVTPSHVLDFSFISPHIGAMGLPAVGSVERLWRNRIEDVSHFLEDRYPGTYAVVNLCTERSYDNGFFNKVMKCPIPDHKVDSLESLLLTCQAMWRFQHIEHRGKHSFLAIHCLGGKGRTGLLICAYMLYSNGRRAGEGAIEAVLYYGSRRTDTRMAGRMKTVSNPCQLRMLGAVEHVMMSGTAEKESAGQAWAAKPRRAVTIERVSLSGLPKGGASTLVVRVSAPQRGSHEVAVLLSSEEDGALQPVGPSATEWVPRTSSKPRVSGGFLLEVCRASGSRRAPPRVVASVWLHTDFLEGSHLQWIPPKRNVMAPRPSALCEWTEATGRSLVVSLRGRNDWDKRSLCVSLKNLRADVTFDLGP